MAYQARPRGTNVCPKDIVYTLIHIISPLLLYFLASVTSHTFTDFLLLLFYFVFTLCVALLFYFLSLLLVSLYYRARWWIAWFWRPPTAAVWKTHQIIISIAARVCGLLLGQFDDILLSETTPATECKSVFKECIGCKIDSKDVKNLNLKNLDFKHSLRHIACLLFNFTLPFFFLEIHETYFLSPPSPSTSLDPAFYLPHFAINLLFILSNELIRVSLAMVIDNNGLKMSHWFTSISGL